MQCKINSVQCKPTMQCKIVIIGCGAAGLSAANHLMKNGITDFVILEGRNRLGGRIVGINIDGCKMELGANWIHGILGNPIYELASANGLINIIQESKPHNVIAALPDGQKVSFDLMQEIYDAYSLFFKRCEEYFLCKYLPPDDIDSVGEHIELEISIYLEQYSDEEKKLRKKIFNYLLNRETCISGCNTMNEIDLMEIGSYTELPGGNIILSGGYSSILEPLTRSIPTEKIRKSHNVIKVKWRTSSSCSDTTKENKCSNVNNSSPMKSESNPKVQVKCENNSSFLANHVICTVPLGVLKEKGQNMFDPPIPDYKISSINRLCFGVVDKIFLEYDRPILNPNLTEIVLLWDEVNKTSPMSERWFKKIYSFSKVSETLLLGWISGEEAKFMESLSSDEVSGKCTSILRQFLNDPCIPLPKRCVCTSWYSQPFTRGSYTAIAVGSSQDDIKNIAHPLYAHPMCSKPSVLFAGEHCHPNFYSTVHGAYLSGKEAAKMLCTSDNPQEMLLEVEETDELSSWVQGISLT